MQSPPSPNASSHAFHVMWEGPFDSPTSFAKINRELLARLQKQPLGHFSPADTAAGTAASAAMPVPDILVSHGLPERQQPPDPPSKWVAILPWDYGIAPRQRAQRAREIDEIWVPSQFCLESYVRAGVPREQLCVMPNAVDTQVYTPAGPTKELPTHKSLRLLYVGGSLHRKGIDLLLSCYLEAFGPDDDVCLVIKDHGSHGQYAASSLYAELCARTGRADQAEVLIYNDDFWSDAELSALYRACQVYVHPYRGEGFGLPILEAMACGLPCVIPAGGPAPEFCPPGASWQLPVNTHFLRRMAFADPSYFKEDTDLPSFYIEVQRQALIDCLRALPKQREACQEKGQTARTAALAYDWEPLAQRVAQRLQTLADGRTPRRQCPHSEEHRATSAGPAPERPPRVWREPGLPGADLVPPDWCCDDAQQADLALGSGQTWPSHMLPRIVWLQHPPPGPLPEADYCWSAEESWAKGFSGPVAFLPEALDFGFFHPHLPRRPQLLCVCRWSSGAWQTLLRALSACAPTCFPAQLELVLVPLDLPLTQAQRELTAWQHRQSPSLPVRLLAAPHTAADRRALYRDAVGFIDSDPAAAGSWHLQAQAMGIPCLGAGQRPFLHAPWARVLASPADWAAGLAYLLRDPRADYDGLAIREHLQTRHDLPIVRSQMAQELSRIWRLQRTPQSPQ